MAAEACGACREWRRIEPVPTSVISNPIVLDAPCRTRGYGRSLRGGRLSTSLNRERGLCRMPVVYICMMMVSVFVAPSLTVRSRQEALLSCSGHLQMINSQIFVTGSRASIKRALTWPKFAARTSTSFHGSLEKEKQDMSKPSRIGPANMSTTSSVRARRTQSTKKRSSWGLRGYIPASSTKARAHCDCKLKAKVLERLLPWCACLVVV